MNKSYIYTITLITITLLISSCSKWDEKHLKEFSRITSPDSTVDAIKIVDWGGGALTKIVTLIYIVPAGTKINDYDTYLLSATYVDSLALHWIKSGILEINYNKGRIIKFQNIWSSKLDENKPYVVELRLVKVGKD